MGGGTGANGGLRVAIVGNGGREMALGWKIGLSPLVAGTAILNSANSVDETVFFARDNNFDLVIVGPEAPLVGGLVDRLQIAGIPAFGPTAAAARLEGSKIFMKELCTEHGIPTARWDSFGTGAIEGSLKAFRVADMFIDQFSSPPVVKADGLYGGKGVVVAKTRQEASNAAHDMLMKRKFGDAGSRIIIEERLEGSECSMMFFCQDETAIPLPPARDYKRARDGDEGLNTGGMGAYSPLPDVSDALVEDVRQRILLPVLRAMTMRGTPFHGLLYAGLMLTENGPFVLEFNVRFGDPETQVVLPRLDCDIVPYLLAIARNESGGLARLGSLSVSPTAAVCFTVAARGYPEKPETGHIVKGLEREVQNTLLFPAGVGRGPDGTTVNTGGRVASAIGLGPTIKLARARAAACADLVWFDGAWRRTDIALNV